MNQQLPPNPFSQAVLTINQRMNSNRPRLGGAIILGERALRYWVLRDIFESLLGWPSESIIVGETFDALLLDSRQAPIIYLETKNIGRNIPKTEIEAASKRFSGVHSLELLVFTDLNTWKINTKASNEIASWTPDQDPVAFFDRLKRKRFSG